MCRLDHLEKGEEREREEKEMIILQMVRSERRSYFGRRLSGGWS